MEELEQEMSLGEIFEALKKRWKLIVGLTTAGLVAGLVYVTVLAPPPVFESKTTVFINYRQEGENTLSSNDIMTSQKLALTYGEIIKSLTVMEPVIENLNLEMTPVELLEKVSISQVNETEIISIAVTDEDPALAQAIASEIGDVFSKEISDIMSVDSTSILDEAKIPEESLPEGKMMKVIIATLLGGMISVGLAFLFEFMDRTLKTVDQVERVLQTPVLGVIPDYEPEQRRQ